MPNTVEDFHSKYNELLKYVPSNELSLQNWAHENFRRVLVLTMANYQENEITTILRQFTKSKSGNELVCSFLDKTNARQYYTYFDWNDGRNANTFFSLFGDAFKKQASADVASDPKLDQGVKAFLEIGKTRNILIHQSLHTVDIGNKTANEFIELFDKSLYFINYLRTKFS